MESCGPMASALRVWAKEPRTDCKSVRRRPSCPTSRPIYWQDMRSLPVLLLISGIVASGQSGRSNAPSPVSTLLRAIAPATNPDQAARDVRAIWETDRWFTFPKFEETARNVAAIMKRAGLEDVEIANAPADGVTQGGFWTEPLAWDVHTATHEIVEPQMPADQRALADYQKVPASICMCSRGSGGANGEEVTSHGHFFEQGAHDNATGVASIIGAAETVNRLIQSGKLPRPKRNIRVLGMGECYGTYYYLQQNPDRVKRTV